MRKIKIIFLMLCFFCINKAKAQHWDSLSSGVNYDAAVMYADSVNDYLFVSGSFLVSAGGHPANGIAKWDGNTWSTFANTHSGTDVYAIARYNGNIYASGDFYYGLPYNYVVRWNGTSWDSIGRAGNGAVERLVVYNHELYALGIFSDFAGITSANNILKWNGSNWSSIMDTIFNDYISSIIEYNGELYISGNFENTITGIYRIAKWNGTRWVKLSNGGIYGGMDDIGNMVVYQNELYVSGLFTKADGNVGNYIQKWNGTTWSEVGGGVMGAGGSNGEINDILLYHNKLYVFGDFETAGGVRAEYIASWDGTNWCGLGSSFDNIIISAAVYKDSLYIDGGFHTIDGDSINRIAKWIGGNYVDTCGRIATGIAEHNITTNDGMVVFPNPNTGNTTIQITLTEHTDVKISIYSTLGQLVFQEQLKNKIGLITENIDLSEKINGIYFISVSTTTKLMSAKIIKQ